MLAILVLMYALLSAAGAFVEACFLAECKNMNTNIL